MLNTATKNFTTLALNNSLIYEGSGLNSVIPQGKDVSEVWLLLNLTAEADNTTLTNEQYACIFVVLDRVYS